SSPGSISCTSRSGTSCEKKSFRVDIRGPMIVRCCKLQILCSGGSREFFVFEVVRVNQFQHGIAEKERVLAVIKPPRHFVKVGREMFRRDSMPRSHDAALEQRECRFDGVCVNVSANIHALFVWNRLMLLCRHASFLHGPWIGCKLISNEHVNITAHVLLNVFRQRAGLRILSMEETQIAAALPDADYNLFRLLASVDTPSDFLSAYIGFIYFDCAVQFLKGLVFGHSVPDAVT